MKNGGIKRAHGINLIGMTGTTILLVSPIITGFGGCALVAILYGLFIGGLYPCMKGYYAQIIPSGKETEMQGIYTFSVLILGFLPTAWFAYCDSNDIGGAANAMRIGMMILVIMFSLALLLCVILVNEKNAFSQAAATADLRIRGTYAGSDSAKVEPSPA